MEMIYRSLSSYFLLLLLGIEYDKLDDIFDSFKWNIKTVLVEI